VFAYSPRENVSRRIALELDEDEICNFDTPTNPCFDTYCGVGSTCALSENGEAGCVCNVGTSARAISGATGQRALGSGFATLFCVESDVNLLQSLEGVDPCAQNSCGAGGECLPINGAATCRCDDDHVALRRFDGIQCVPRSIDEAPEQLYPQVRIPPSQSAPRSALCECSSLVPNTPWFSIAGLALCGLFAQRRRRRRR